MFFDYDQRRVSDEARATLQKNADWLKRWTSARAHGRGPLRQSRDAGIQPGARRAARERGARLSGEPRRSGGPRARSSARARSSRSAARTRRAAGRRTGAGTSSSPRSRRTRIRARAGSRARAGPAASFDLQTSRGRISVSRDAVAAAARIRRRDDRPADDEIARARATRVGGRHRAHLVVPCAAADRRGCPA